MEGIEPSISAWKADVLPLHYTRLEPHRGFKPPTELNHAACTTVEDKGIEPLLPACKAGVLPLSLIPRKAMRKSVLPACENIPRLELCGLACSLEKTRFAE